MRRSFHDGDTPRSSVLAGCVVLCQEQDIGSALDTGLLLEALILTMQSDPDETLPYVLRLVEGWQQVQCGLC